MHKQQGPNAQNRQVYSVACGHKKEGNTAITVTWMDLDIIIPSGVSQRKTNII